ncbi:8-oxo-dGTP diphosphatase [compost metagenome]
MKIANLIYLFNHDLTQVLLMKRTKAPFLGLFNGIGGKLEEGETVLAAAYRELEEETGYVSTQHESLVQLTTRSDDHFTIDVFATSLINGHGIPLRDGEDDLNLAWVPMKEVVLAPSELFAPFVQDELVQSAFKLMSERTKTKRSEAK